MLKIIIRSVFFYGHKNKTTRKNRGAFVGYCVFWDCVPKSLVVVAVCSLSFANELCPETLGGWSSRNSDEAVISRLRSDFLFLFLITQMSGPTYVHLDKKLQLQVLVECE